jgi:hypothetical protein
MSSIKKPINVAEIKPVISDATLSSFSKWVPLICAGAAFGVSILALKEIKNVRKELFLMKKETVSQNTADPELSKKIELMDDQIRKITEYLVKKKDKDPIVKNAMKQKEVHIVNNTPVEIASDEEYEEVEVTDDDEQED